MRYPAIQGGTSDTAVADSAASPAGGRLATVAAVARSLSSGHIVPTSPQLARQPSAERFHEGLAKSSQPVTDVRCTCRLQREPERQFGVPTIAVPISVVASKKLLVDGAEPQVTAAARNQVRTQTRANTVQVVEPVGEEVVTIKCAHVGLQHRHEV